MPSPGQFNHVITYVPHGDKPLWLDTTPEVAPFGLLTANLRDKQALVIARDKPAELKRTPANPPFPSSQSFAIEGTLDINGTFQGHVRQTLRGDVEVVYRYRFRQVSAAQWKDLVQLISGAMGFSGEVSNVSATPADDTSQPFELSYDYTRKEYGGDWSNHRVIAPFPPMGVEGAAIQQKKPSDPVDLGAPEVVVYTAKITLPIEVVKLPSDISLSEPYADFHSEYSVKGNVLTAIRRMTVKHREVSLDQWEEYKKFSKAISDDWSAWIEMHANAEEKTADGGAAVPTPSRQPTPEVTEKMQQAFEALQRGDTTTAEEIVRDVLAKDPQTEGLHEFLGYIYGRRNNGAAAVEEFYKEEELYPDNLEAYRTLAGFFLYQNKADKAEEQYRKWLTIDPNSYDAMVGLSGALYRQKKFAERVVSWEKASALLPDNSKVSFSLALAYLDNKQADKAMPLLEKALASESKPMNFNHVAYSLADQNVHLDRAKEWGDKALQGLEAESLKTDTEEAALANTSNIAATWDTVGWIYFRRGDLDKAELYVRDSFTLSQNSVVGDHLGQVYEKLGKKQEAAHTYRLAFAASNSRDNSQIMDHYRRLMGKDANMGPAIKRNPDGSWTQTPVEELSRARNYKIYTAAHNNGSATFSVVFSPGKIEDVKFVSGDEELKPMSSTITSSKMRIDFPNSDPVHLARRGILVCGSRGCDFTLLLPDSVHAN